MPNNRQTCGRCDLSKLLSFFPYNKKRGYHDTICKACKAETLRALRKKWKLNALKDPGRRTADIGTTLTHSTNHQPGVRPEMPLYQSIPDVLNVGIKPW